MENSASDSYCLSEEIAVGLSAGIEGKVFLQGVWVNAGS